MPSPAVERLQQITTFPQLVKYLRDELDWPIDQDKFEDLVFDWDADELGLDLKTAAKISEIKQLRPLTASQPWGIFFVKFEPKQLPIVVLRRILSQLVIKKRASARRSEQQTWQARDLLFISSHGEGGERQMTFAHFNEPGNDRDLPTLRVLGWHGDDTTLHLDHAARTLKQKLTWPRDPTAVDLWRDTWSSAFILRPREVIRTSKELSIRLADLAKGIRDRARVVLELESERGSLSRLHRAFREALIHDLSEADFADMYAQTITYGLFSAAVSGQSGGRKAGLVAEDVGDQVPVTNPFLRELLGNFLKAGGRKERIDFDELGIQEVVDLLNSPDTHLDAVLRDFGNRTRDEDPVIHFYESFLQEYDRAKKIARGVFYTPQPVVSFIVRSVDDLLRSEFGLSDGLADTTTWGEMVKRRPGLQLPRLTDDPGEVRTISPDEPFVQVLDPATGTATFLVEAIEVIHRTLEAKWKERRLTEVQQRAEWNDYVPKHLLPRLHAFELMMAPYAIAHMKVGLKLAETGYRFGTDERARIYLTNSLEPWVKQLPLIGFDALAHEAASVNEVKRHKRFTVIFGNPPYAGHSKNNEIKWIVELVKDFTRDEPSLQGPGQGKWLQDDYVKFLRLSEYLLAPTRAAVLAMITNHRYLSNRTFRGMRRLWGNYLPFARILDLHGNRVVNEVSPLGYDENVFDIEQGVAIGIFVKGGASGAGIAHHDLWGSRSTPDNTGKYDFLESHSVTSTNWEQLNPSAPDWLFSPRAEVSEDLRSDFDGWIKMLDLMPGALGPNGKPQSGLATMHDGFALSFSPAEVEEKIRQFVRTTSRVQAKELFGTLCNPQQWDYATAKRTLSSASWREKVSRIWFTPFDTRFTVYDKAVAVHLRRRLSDHLFNHENLALVIGEAGQEISGDEWDAVSCVNSLLQLNYFRRNGSPTLPLYLYDDDPLMAGVGGRRVNLSPPLLAQLAGRLGLRIEKDGLPTRVTPEDIFQYAYAVFHSPGYRSRYAEFLKSEFPRLPLTGDLVLFRELARFGSSLVTLHLLEAGKKGKVITEFIGGRDPEVERVSWSRNTVWLDKAETTGFGGVHEDVWKFHIGGYQVCEKWLKERKGRALSKDDVTHYQRIVVALSETIRIMKEIDQVIESRGGWPGAFRGRNVAGDSSGTPLLKVAEPQVPPYGEIGTE